MPISTELDPGSTDRSNPISLESCMTSRNLQIGGWVQGLHDRLLSTYIQAYCFMKGAGGEARYDPDNADKLLYMSFMNLLSSGTLNGNTDWYKLGFSATVLYVTLFGIERIVTYRQLSSKGKVESENLLTNENVTPYTGNEYLWHPDPKVHRRNMRRMSRR